MADPVDRAIIAALQINGRASWRRIAAALNEPERTVARRATQLLASGTVKVVALASPVRTGRGEPALLHFRCRPNQLRSVARTLASRPESLWVYAVAGASEGIAEIFCPPDRLGDFLFDFLANQPGLLDYRIRPIVSYYKAIEDWRPELVTGPGFEALVDPLVDEEIDAFGPVLQLSPEEEVIVAALAEDGRLTHEELGRLAGVSKATARRRAGSLLSRGVIDIRAVVAPALLGYPTEAVISVQCAVREVDSVAEELSKLSTVRYAAAVTGEYPLVAQVAVPDRAALHRMLTTAPPLDTVGPVDAWIVVEVFKRSDVIP